MPAARLPSLSERMTAAVSSTRSLRLRQRRASRARGGRCRPRRSTPGEFFTLLGPSGSGKTTCLRMIGGFSCPAPGRIRIDGADVTRRAALRAAGEHGVPGLRAVPAHERPRQRRLWADGAGRGQGRARARAPTSCWRWCSCRGRRPQAGAAVGRPAPARGAGARADQPAARAAAGRTAGRAGPEAARADAERAEGAAAQAGHHLRLRHP